MINFPVALIYVGFFTMITLAVIFTSSGWPLWALLLAPSIKRTEENN